MASARYRQSGAAERSCRGLQQRALYDAGIDLARSLSRVRDAKVVRRAAQVEILTARLDSRAVIGANQEPVGNFVRALCRARASVRELEHRGRALAAVPETKQRA